MTEKQAETPILAIIDYGMGNLRSVAKAFEHCGAQVRVVTSADFDFEPTALVLPGVGALSDCIAGLRQTGLDARVRQWIAADKPFFGICLGMQALFESSEEGNTSGLGILPGHVVRFQLPSEFKVPHMGWNTVQFSQETPVCAGLSRKDSYVYFVHSYHCVPENAQLVWANTSYGGVNFVSAVRQGNCFATQFHPEKSQSTGLQIYSNFVQWLK